MQVRVLLEAEIRGLIGPAAALPAVRDAFAALARGEATLPGVIGFDVPAHQGEVHVKGAYLHGAPYYSIKEAAGFYANAERGLPVGSGLVLVFDATTGFLAAILFDNGYLTELRTGAAGALAADLLARRRVDRVAVIGAGSQARFQLEALALVRRPASVTVFGRSPARAATYAREMQERIGFPVRVAASAREAVEGADVVITATPSRAPIVRGEWLGPGAHVTAVGADGPEKQELEPEVLARADKVVVDRLDQCLRLGELHHAVEAGLLAAGDVWAELGELAAGQKPGRESEDEITVADLTGVGIQDAAVASAVVAEAVRRNVGRTIEI
jgi:ectoine utilization protein EutC